MKLSAFSSRRVTWTKEVRPMFERLAFAIYLAVVVGACGLVGLGLIFAMFRQDLRLLCVGLAAGAFARLFQQHGYRVWHFERWEDSLEVREMQMGFGEDSLPAKKMQECEALLRELEVPGALEVWAVQERRQRVKALLAEEPTLREVFASELSRHPELG